MTKREIFEQAMVICEDLQLGEDAEKAFTTLLEPKKGGAAFNIDDVVTRDEAGTITHILDSVFNVMVPVFDAEGNPNFYEKPDTELGWSRFSRAAEKSRKEREKTFKATEKGVFTDLMSAVITPEEAKALMEKATEVRTSVIVPEDLV